MSVFQTASQDIKANTLIPFDFEENPVRVTLDEHGAPWFHAGDVCRVLGYTNPSKTVSDHVDPEDLTKRDTLTAGGVQQANYVNESGLYALIFGSTKPEAKRFKRWVTGDVLPAIRKTGGYGTDQTMLEGMARMVEQLQRISKELQQPSTAIPPMPRSELKAKYDRYGYMAYHQAVQPIHLEHGQAWTTTLEPHQFLWLWPLSPMVRCRWWCLEPHQFLWLWPLSPMVRCRWWRLEPHQSPEPWPLAVRWPEPASPRPSPVGMRRRQHLLWSFALPQCGSGIGLLRT
ncbi:MAG: hypothetical protein HQL77_14065 [Magnetococcales bacterium]|nr:hypothetical protein [Magnetococcales bacterium]